MSLGRSELELSAVTDPQMYFHPIRSIPVLKGPQIVTAQSFPAPAPIPASGLNIQCSPPSRDILISRRVLLKMQFTITFTCTNIKGGAPPLALSSFDGPRAMPIQSILSSMTWQIGNDTITSGGPMYQYVPALLRYHNGKDSMDRNYSIAPAMLDTMANYNNTTKYIPPLNRLGDEFNPLNAYGENPVVAARGAFPLTAVTNTANTSPASVTFTSVEPIFISPFVFANDDGMANCLTGIQALNFQCTFINNLARIWSHVNATDNSPQNGDGKEGNSDINNATGYAVVINAAELQFIYLTPPPSLAIPKQLSWPYYNPVIYATNVGGTLQPFVSAINDDNSTLSGVQQNTITLDGIPRRLYIFARKNDTDWNVSTSSDTFFYIDNLQIQFNNGTYMSSMSGHQLYEMSRRNGCNLSWPAWRQYVGSVICVNMGVDLGLSGLYDAPGKTGQYNLSVRVTMQNLSQNTVVNPMLFVLAVYEGQLQVKNNSVSHSTNLLTSEDIARARELPHVVYDPSNEVWGGNLFKSLLSGSKNFFNKVKDFASKALPIADRITASTPELSGVNSVVRSIRDATGLGYRSRYRGRGLLDKDEGYRVKPRYLDEEYDQQESSDDQDAFEQYEGIKKNPLSRLLTRS